MVYGHSWNFMDPGSKDTVLGVLQREVDATFDLVADPARVGKPQPRARDGRCATSSVTSSTPPRGISRTSPSRER